ncbi:UDP-N-acetylmuramate:L-alanyl-gamma-D-glutamyl-meso-diaminopimelate ligase [Thermodesulfobacteriota bacterium]
MEYNNFTRKTAAGLIREYNRIPFEPKHIHLMGICGTAMASLAGILKEEGYHVTGSDENVYPPMSLLLWEMGIKIIKGYSENNLESVPDLVIVGNVITAKNPEAIKLSKLKIPYISLPQALRRFAIGDKKSIVISGTHGKSTTSAICAWMLEKAGVDPGYMIGGVLNNFKSNFKLGRGAYYVIEGDEYDTAFFDKGPKFLHYAPFITVITSIEFDHADIYRDLDHVISSFRKLIEIIPENGLLIANGDDPIVLEESERAKCPVKLYGFSDGLHWRAVNVENSTDGTSVRILNNGKEYLKVFGTLYGNHNISNLLSVIALSEYIGLKKDAVRDAVRTFKGVKRRQEIRGEENGILVLDDFAHHPTAVEKTVEAVKDRYKERRLAAVFEPRSNSSRRGIFQERYSMVFDPADLVFIPEPPMMDKVPENNRFSSAKLVETLRDRDIDAYYCSTNDQLLEEILNKIRPGDVVLIMSNGSFDNIHERLLERLKN